MLQGFEILDCDFVKENKYMKSHWHIIREGLAITKLNSERM